MEKILSQLTLFILLLVPGFLNAQTGGAGAVGDAPKMLYSRAEIRLDSQHTLAMLASLGLAVDHGQHKRGHSFTSDFSKSELESAIQHGFAVNVLIEDVVDFYRNQNKASRGGQNTDYCGLKEAAVPQNFSLGSMGGYFTLQEMLNQLDSMHSRYPQLISVKKPISTSLLTENGNPLYWIRISDNPDSNETDEPEILMTALHHAREPLSLSQLIFYMWYLLENYAGNQEVKQLVNATELYILPCVNPDGYLFNQQTEPNGGGLWRKNRKNNGNGRFGVDLNRNYGKFWGFDNEGSSPAMNSETYRGTAAFSEPENRLVKEFCEQHTFMLALNNHTFSNEMLYPYGHLDGSSSAPDSAALRKIAETLNRESHFYYGTCYETLNYIANGVSDDWMYGDTTGKPKIMAFTPEYGEYNLGFWPPADYIVPACANAVYVNLEMQKLSVPYGKVFDDSPYFFDEPLSGNLPFRFARLGLETDTFTIEAIPLQNISFTSFQPATAFSPGLSDTLSFSYDYQLPTGLHEGDRIRYEWIVSNGSFVWRDTVERVYGKVEVLINDAGNSMNQWTTEGNFLSWGISELSSHSSPTSFADSPNWQYEPEKEIFLEFREDVDLTSLIDARLEFWSWWQTAQYKDKMQIQVARVTEGWEDQCTNWTTVHYPPGTGNNGPVVDGRTREWKKHFLPLTAFAGQKIRLRFLFTSGDEFNFLDGIYIDDVFLSGIKDVSIGTADLSSNGVVVFPNPATDELNVTFTQTGSYRLKLTDLTGKEVLRFNTSGLNARLSTLGLESGIYLLEMENPDFEKQVRKVCISRN